MKETVQINASSKISLGTVAQQGMCPPFLQQEIFGLEQTLGPSQGVGSLGDSARDLGDCARDLRDQINGNNLPFISLLFAVLLAESQGQSGLRHSLAWDSGRPAD